jgi:hypothetical protein
MELGVTEISAIIGATVAVVVGVKFYPTNRQAGMPFSTHQAIVLSACKSSLARATGWAIVSHSAAFG